MTWRHLLLLMAGACTGLPEGESIVTGACPVGLAVDDVNVYWIDHCDGAIKEAPKSGGTPEVLVTGESAAGRIAVDDAWLYWQRGPNVQAGAGAIVKAPKSGGPVIELASNLGSPFNLNIDDLYVYWTDLRDGTLMVVPKDGSAPARELATTNCPSGLVPFGDSGQVYWLDCDTFYRQPEGGAGTSEPLFTIDASSEGDGYVLSDGLLFYWLLHPTGDVTANVTLDRFDTTTGAQLELESHGTSPGVVASGHLYWIRDGEIVRDTFDGGHIESVARTGGGGAVVALGYDQQYLYWANDGMTAILRAHQ